MIDDLVTKKLGYNDVFRAAIEHRYRVHINHITFHHFLKMTYQDDLQSMPRYLSYTNFNQDVELT